MLMGVGFFYLTSDSIHLGLLINPSKQVKTSPFIEKTLLTGGCLPHKGERVLIQNNGLIF